jgi:putative flippase GtrA
VTEAEIIATTRPNATGGFVRLAAQGSKPLSASVSQIFHETWKYFLVSLAALAVDYGLLVGLTSGLHVYYLVSAAVGFSAGLVLNYALSVAFVFRERRLQSRPREFVGFMLIGVAGLALNEALMKAFVETAGLGYALAKIPATGVGFTFNFVARRFILFSKAQRPLRPSTVPRVDAA